MSEMENIAFRGGPMEGVTVAVAVDQSGTPAPFQLRMVGDVRSSYNDTPKDCIFGSAWYLPAMVQRSVWELHLDREFTWDRS